MTISFDLLTANVLELSLNQTGREARALWDIQENNCDFVLKVLTRYSPPSSYFVSCKGLILHIRLRQ